MIEMALHVLARVIGWTWKLWERSRNPLAARRGEDCVWLDDAARRNGLAREIEALLNAGRSVVIVTLSNAAFEELAGIFAARSPVRCADACGRDALKASVSKPGWLAIAMSGALPLDLARAENAGVDIHVFGRNPKRVADEAIERFAEALGPNAHLVFHLSLEDPLLRLSSGSTIRPIMEKLGLTPEKPITHPLITRAIRNAQKKAGD